MSSRSFRILFATLVGCGVLSKDAQAQDGSFDIDHLLEIADLNDDGTPETLMWGGAGPGALAGATGGLTYGSISDGYDCLYEDYTSECGIDGSSDEDSSAFSGMQGDLVRVVVNDHTVSIYLRFDPLGHSPSSPRWRQHGYDLDEAALSHLRHRGYDSSVMNGVLHLWKTTDGDSFYRLVDGRTGITIAKGDDRPLWCGCSEEALRATQDTWLCRGLWLLI